MKAFYALCHTCEPDKDGSGTFKKEAVYVTLGINPDWAIGVNPDRILVSSKDIFLTERGEPVLRLEYVANRDDSKVGSVFNLDGSYYSYRALPFATVIEKACLRRDEKISTYSSNFSRTPSFRMNLLANFP